MIGDQVVVEVLPTSKWVANSAGTDGIVTDALEKEDQPEGEVKDGEDEDDLDEKLLESMLKNKDKRVTGNVVGVITRNSKTFAGHTVAYKDMTEDHQKLFVLHLKQMGLKLKEKES